MQVLLLYCSGVQNIRNKRNTHCCCGTEFAYSTVRYLAAGEYWIISCVLSCLIICRWVAVSDIKLFCSRRKEAFFMPGKGMEWAAWCTQPTLPGTVLYLHSLFGVVFHRQGWCVGAFQLMLHNSHKKGTTVYCTPHTLHFCYFYVHDIITVAIFFRFSIVQLSTLFV